jgi:IS5 family transposase
VIVTAPANRHDALLLDPTQAAMPVTDTTMTVHLDRGDDAVRTRTLLAARGLDAEIARKGCPARITAGKRWVVERTTARTNAHKKLVWCTERRAAVIAFSPVIIIVGRLVHEGWVRYRWETHPARRP